MEKHNINIINRYYNLWACAPVTTVIHENYRLHREKCVSHSGPQWTVKHFNFLSSDWHRVNLLFYIKRPSLRKKTSSRKYRWRMDYSKWTNNDLKLMESFKCAELFDKRFYFEIWRRARESYYLIENKNTKYLKIIIDPEDAARGNWHVLWYLTSRDA